MMQGVDLAGVLWDFRSTVCKKAKRLEGLVGSFERLQVTRVLIESSMIVKDFTLCVVVDQLMYFSLSN